MPASVLKLAQGPYLAVARPLWVDSQSQCASPRGSLSTSGAPGSIVAPAHYHNHGLAGSARPDMHDSRTVIFDKLMHTPSF